MASAHDARDACSLRSNVRAATQAALGSPITAYSALQPHTRWIMDQRRPNVEEYALVESHEFRRSTSLDQDADDTLRPLSARSEGLHLASLAEKKRLWWRNAIINLLFIASWCACPLSTKMINFDYVQVFLCNPPICVQQMDVFTPVLWLPGASLCDDYAHVRAVRTCVVSPVYLATTLPTQERPKASRLWVSNVPFFILHTFCASLWPVTVIPPI
jgi:hypothetical protein